MCVFLCGVCLCLCLCLCVLDEEVLRTGGDPSSHVPVDDCGSGLACHPVGY